MDDNKVETLEDLCNYVAKSSKTIYVREQVNGVWCSVALGDLPGYLAIQHAMDFVLDGRIPVRIKEGGKIDQYTKGEWKANGTFVEMDTTPICSTSSVNNLPRDEAMGNAYLLAAAVNGCQEVNPENPMAVAESIKEMYEALKGLLEGLDNPMRIPAFELVDKASLALAKAEGKETSV